MKKEFAELLSSNVMGETAEVLKPEETLDWVDLKTYSVRFESISDIVSSVAIAMNTPDEAKRKQCIIDTLKLRFSKSGGYYTVY